MLLKRVSGRLFLAGAGAVLCGLLAVPSIATARATPAPCHYEAVKVKNGFPGRHWCEWSRPGNGSDSGSIVVRDLDDDGDDDVVGYLHGDDGGHNWIVCQQKGVTVQRGERKNYWYGYTQSDNGPNGYQWGWASALDAKGGTNYGWFFGVPNCDGRFGPTPARPDLWGSEGTTPPADSPPPAEPPQDVSSPSPRPSGPVVVLGGPAPARTPAPPDRCTPKGAKIRVELAAQATANVFPGVRAPEISSVEYRTAPELRPGATGPPAVSRPVTTSRAPFFRRKLRNPYRRGTLVRVYARVSFRWKPLSEGEIQLPQVSRSSRRIRICGGGRPSSSGPGTARPN